MPDLLPGSRIEVRQPSVPRVQVEQPAGASTSIYAPAVSWRAELAAAVAALLDGAPGALDTLNELAAALGDDANFAATVTTLLAGKASTGDLAAEATAREAADTALDASIDSKVTAAVAGHTPGIELAYAERITNFATTSTVHGAGALVPSLVVSVVGDGRAVDIEFNAQTVLHSVADTGVLAGFEVNGSATSALCGSTVVSSPSNTIGRGLTVRRRVVLTDGVTYTIKAYIYGLAAGTSTIVAAAFAPTALSVTSRE